MANDYGVFNQGAVVLEYWSGVITLDELLKHELQQSEDSLIQKCSMVLVDCRDALFKVDQTGVKIFSQHILARQKYTFKKVALLINPNTWDIASDYSEQFWGSDNTVMAFHSLDAASVWLDLDGHNVEKRLFKLKAGLSQLASDLIE
ncbi:hypothetical protein ACU6U9_12915 [Pseudomonas sp. HK3]|jgi:hypothetical protein